MEKLFVKNMVCDRCKMVVKQELEKLGLNALTIELGEVSLADSPSETVYQKIKASFEHVGFELIDDKKAQWIGKIKSTIIEMIHSNKGKNLRMNYSDYLAQQVGRDYSYLSSLFSEVEGLTIEHYIINQKIERVKELLAYNELTLSQIASEMGYSSVAHLSSQFKKVTGFTPSHFKTIDENKRRSLDKV